MLLMLRAWLPDVVQGAQQGLAKVLFLSTALPGSVGVLAGVYL